MGKGQQVAPRRTARARLAGARRIYALLIAATPTALGRQMRARIALNATAPSACVATLEEPRDGWRHHSLRQPGAHLLVVVSHAVGSRTGPCPRGRIPWILNKTRLWRINWQAQTTMFLIALEQAQAGSAGGQRDRPGRHPRWGAVRAFVDALGQLNQQVAQVCAARHPHSSRAAADPEKRPYESHPVKRIVIVVAVLLMLLLLMWGTARARALQLPGRPGPYRPAGAHTATRIVSLLPSLAETVLRAGSMPAPGRCGPPPTGPSVRKLPRWAAGWTRHRGHRRAAARRGAHGHLSRARRRGSNRWAFPRSRWNPKTHADVQRVLGKGRQLLGVPDAQRVWRATDMALTAAVAQPRRVVRASFEVSLWLAPGELLHWQTLTRLGAYPAGCAGALSQAQPEFVVRADPDLIMVGAQHESLARRPAEQMRARCAGSAVFTPESDVLIRLARA